MQFEVLGQKAYLIGGLDFTESDDDSDDDDDMGNIVDEVYCYDAMTNSWGKASPLSTPRCHFASVVLDGKIYAVGSELNPLGRRTWEAYDPITNNWTAQSYPYAIDQSIEFIVHNGKLYARRNARHFEVEVDPSDFPGAVYDPSTGTWDFEVVDDPVLDEYDGTSVDSDRNSEVDPSESDDVPEAVYDPSTGMLNLVVDDIVLDKYGTCVVLDGEHHVLKPSGVRGAVYDPSTCEWDDADNGFVSGWAGTSLVVDGRLYGFDVIEEELKLRTWDEDGKEWMSVLLSDVMEPSPPVEENCVVGIGKSMFFVGEGLYTVELDLSNVEVGGEPLPSVVTEPVSESWPKRNPMICKCMTL